MSVTEQRTQPKAMRPVDIYSHNKEALLDANGVSYKAFRNGLDARFFTVWRDITLAWVVIIALQAMLIFCVFESLPWVVLATLVVGLLTGFFLANLMLFMHEATHFNIHPDKRWNDRLCNIFLSGVIGIDVADYRIVHWQHHRELGTTEDSERSYFDAITLRYIIESLLLIRALKVVLQRRAMTAQQPREAAASSRRVPVAVLGFAANVVYIGVLLFQGAYAAALAWVLAVVVFYPAFGALRQVMEHRSLDARSDVDYTQVAHGVTNRMFYRGPFSFFFGGAGFNRHLLHHFDPSVSYTRLPEVEEFLMRTEFAREVAGSYTSYGRVFRQLFQWRATA